MKSHLIRGQLFGIFYLFCGLLPVGTFHLFDGLLPLGNSHLLGASILPGAPRLIYSNIRSTWVYWMYLKVLNYSNWLLYCANNALSSCGLAALARLWRESVIVELLVEV